MTDEKKLPLPNTYSEVAVKEELTVSNMAKSKSLKLSPQKRITDEPIISIVDEANEISTLEITINIT